MAPKTTTYRYSYFHKGKKKWRRSPASLATVRAFLAVNGLDGDLDPAMVLKALDRDGTYVTLVRSNEDTIKAGTNIAEIDEYYGEL